MSPRRRSTLAHSEFAIQRSPVLHVLPSVHTARWLIHGPHTDDDGVGYVYLVDVECSRSRSANNANLQLLESFTTRERDLERGSNTRRSDRRFSECHVTQRERELCCKHTITCSKVCTEEAAAAEGERIPKGTTSLCEEEERERTSRVVTKEREPKDMRKGPRSLRRVFRYQVHFRVQRFRMTLLLLLLPLRSE